MLSDEEKAIEMIEHIQECNTLIGYGVEDRTILAKALLNLIEKQSKEIEELKRNKKFLEKQEIEYIRDRTEDEVNIKWKDKIKAKIEEYDDKGMTINLTNRSFRKTFQQALRTEVKKILHSLLEKE